MTREERQAIAAKKWYEKNKDLISNKRKGNRVEESKSYYEKNKDYCNAKAKQWSKDNPEKVKDIQRKSRAKDDAKRLFNLVKNRAANKGIEFNLTIDYLRSLIRTHCPYLGTPFIYGHKEQSMSVDRIDNSKGYVIGNVEIISIKANRMKNTATIDDLLTFANSIITKYRYKDI